MRLSSSRQFLSGHKIRLAGGEPTIRKDIIHIVEQLKSLRDKALKKICMMSNGVSLGRKLEKLAAAGLTHLDLSLNTLVPAKFGYITRCKGIDKVLSSLHRVVDRGLTVKLNCVPVKGFNEDELVGMARLAGKLPIHVGFIEFMPFEGNRWNEAKTAPSMAILDNFRTVFLGIPAEVTEKPRASDSYSVPGFRGRIGFISSMMDAFCGTCNCIRQTADGRRASQRERVAAGEAEETLVEIISMTVKRKAYKYAGIDILHTQPNRPMVLIGG
ncbi:Molybdenum cofactor synthesis protein 1 [Madurella fahalii]|uniref:Molybdenum cofactor synthesis protein 1 n=1 Tax=Madurella fahalii TaxID=1157608 RepID=A0ABQ0GA79_9PEZI